jgi:hypothetical protein
MNIEENNQVKMIKSLLAYIPEKHLFEVIKTVEKAHEEIYALSKEKEFLIESHKLESQQSLDLLKEIDQLKAFITDNEFDCYPEFKRYFPVGFRY